MKTRGVIAVIISFTGLILMSASEAAIRQKQDILSRDFGYVIGDIVKRKIILEIEHPHTMSQEQIPKPGRINRWLELRRSDVQIKSHKEFSRYQIELEYQIFNSEPGHTEIFLPGFDLYITTSERTLPAVFHDRPIRVMSITEDDPSRSLEFLDLQPPISPQPVSEFSGWIKLGFAVLGICLSLLLVVYVYAVFPWIERLNGPFAQAARKIRSLRKSADMKDASHKALKHIHTAFNQTYGKVLLHDDLEMFFQKQPAFKKLQQELTSLFVYSRALFFDEPETSERTVSELLDICRQCRDVERGLL